MTLLVRPPLSGILKPSSAGGGPPPPDDPPVTSGLVLNWQADTVLVADGQEIGTGDWFDSGPLDNHPVNGSGSGKPIYRATGGPGGRPAVQFAGSNPSFFALTTVIPSTDHTVFAILKPSDTSPRTVICGTTQALQYRIYQLKQDLVAASVTDYGSGTTALSTSAFSSVNATFNKTTRAFAYRLNGAADGTGTGGSPSPNQGFNAVGWNEAEVITHEPFLGYISAVMVYNVILSGAEIGDVEAWLADRWEM